jgi:hypothetical protein
MKLELDQYIGAVAVIASGIFVGLLAHSAYEKRKNLLGAIAMGGMHYGSIGSKPPSIAIEAGFGPQYGAVEATRQMGMIHR